MFRFSMWYAVDRSSSYSIFNICIIEITRHTNRFVRDRSRVVYLATRVWLRTIFPYNKHECSTSTYFFLEFIKRYTGCLSGWCYLKSFQKNYNFKIFKISNVIKFLYFFIFSKLLNFLIWNFENFENFKLINFLISILSSLSNSKFL